MGGPTKRDSTTEKKFNLGETVSVRTNNSNTKVEKGHTRLPDYVKGRSGKVIAYHGSHVLPDANAHFLGKVRKHSTLWNLFAKIYVINVYLLRIL